MNPARDIRRSTRIEGRGGGETANLAQRVINDCIVYLFVSRSYTFSYVYRRYTFVYLLYISYIYIILRSDARIGDVRSYRGNSRIGVPSLSIFIDTIDKHWQSIVVDKKNNLSIIIDSFHVGFLNAAFDDINIILLRSKNNIPLLNHEETKCIPDILACLKIFAVMTEKLSGESYATISLLRVDRTYGGDSYRPAANYGFVRYVLQLKYRENHNKIIIFLISNTIRRSLKSDFLEKRSK